MRDVLPHGARAAGRAVARVERRHPDAGGAAVPDSGRLRGVCIPQGQAARGIAGHKQLMTPGGLDA
jgi:hypothetical protein